MIAFVKLYFYKYSQNVNNYFLLNLLQLLEKLLTRISLTVPNYSGYLLIVFNTTYHTLDETF